MTDWIVVPEGLDRAAPGVEPRPSWIYEGVLDVVADLAQDQDRIFLAPANTFGQSLPEHEAAFKFLTETLRRKSKSQITVHRPTLEPTGYIDTRGNAVELRKWLVAQKITLTKECVLVAYAPHVKRAEVCFKQEGYTLRDVYSVSLHQLKPRPIVGRLFYYRYPPLHWIYETALTTLCRLRLM